MADKQETFETFDFDLQPVRGFPELRWTGKRAFNSTQYYPAQRKEQYGDPTQGWWNKIFWGDNLQVMSHMLRDYRNGVDLIYIDPPFDTGVSYSKSVRLKGKSKVVGDQAFFEEKQYSDLWVNDAFCQFLLDRFVLCRELLAEHGNLIVHCNPQSSPIVRMLLNEVFSPSLFRNEIVWARTTAGKPGSKVLPTNTDRLTWYSKSDHYRFNRPTQPLSDEDKASYNKDDGDGRGPYNTQPIINPAYRPNLRYRYEDRNGKVWEPPSNGWRFSEARMRQAEEEGRLAFSENGIREKYFLRERESQGKQRPDYWVDIPGNALGYSSESTGYPTQKPETLLNRVIDAFSDEGDLVFDCFMGSGTTQACAMKLGRRFIGADINSGSVETTTKRLNLVRSEILADAQLDSGVGRQVYAGFEVYNVNNYDIFRNPVEAKELIKEAMELQPLPTSSVFDGQRDQFLVKIMPVNRIATRQDLNEVINGMDFKAYERRRTEAPSKVVDRIMLVCMGHEPDLGPELVKAAKPFNIEVEVVDLIRDKANLHFKRQSDAKLVIRDGHLEIAGFYPLNLLQKLSMDTDAVEDWRQLVETIKVDWNYDGAVLSPELIDAPEKEALVKGRYPIPKDASTIRVKITDLLSESWEGEIENG